MDPWIFGLLVVWSIIWKGWLFESGKAEIYRVVYCPADH
jgi:hypothetical protein